MGGDISYKDARILAANLVSGIKNSVLTSLDYDDNDDNISKKQQESTGYHFHPSNSSRIAIPNSRSSCKFDVNTLYSENSTGAHILQEMDERKVKNGYELFKPLVNGIRSLPNEFQSNTSQIYHNDLLKEIEMDEKLDDYSNIKYGKKCPKCAEINDKDANWCMECGKAIISVEIRRCDSFDEAKKYTAPFQHREEKSNHAEIALEQCEVGTAILGSFNDLHLYSNGLMTNKVPLKSQLNMNIASSCNSTFTDFSMNMQSEDYHTQCDKTNQRNTAIYKRAVNAEKNQELPYFYAFDDLLYPNHAMDDPIMGYVLPSSNIVSNSRAPFCLKSYEGDWILNLESEHNERPPSAGMKRNRKKWRKKRGKKAVITLPVPTDEKEHNITESHSNDEKERSESFSRAISPSCCLNIPDEIILQIFSFLNMPNLATCARVCKQFCRIVGDESLWKSISLRKKHKINDEILRKISKKHPSSLTITHCNTKNITMVGLQNLFSTCNQSLKVLDISGSGGGVFYGESLLLHVSTHCHNIQSLDVSWSNVSNEGVHSICSASTRIVRLFLNGCQGITDDSIKAVTEKHGDSLEILELFGCFNITPVAINLIALKCKALQVLNLGQCHKVTNAALCNIAKGLPNLESLDIRGCKQVRDLYLKEIITNCQMLSTFVIANCPAVTDSTLIALASCRPNLRYLDICGLGKITDRGVQALSRSCRMLRSLDLSSTKATFRSVIAISKNCREELESLKLSFCHSITITSLHALVSSCKKLKTLHLYGCRPLPNLMKLMELNPDLNIEKESLR